MERPTDPYAALRVASYRPYLIGSFLSLFSRQGVVVALTWQVYEWTHSATALGFVGLVNVLPVLALSLPAGILADTKDRKRVLQVGATFYCLLNLALALLATHHLAVPHTPILDASNRAIRWAALLFESKRNAALVQFSDPAIPILYLLVLGLATTRILIWPSRSSITPLLVPTELLPNAITWSSSSMELATVAGPAAGGFLIGFGGFGSVYVGAAFFEAAYLVALTRVFYFRAPEREAKAKRRWADLFTGARFIWSKKAILGASSLDLFAVLLGGAVALLPIYADQILHVGAIGLGWLRAAPSIGAIAMALWTAHRKPFTTPGIVLLWAVAAFGASIMLFGISRVFWLSFVALVLSGAFDNISVVIRNSLVQLLTPDRLRGRVTAVNQMFVGSSNEVGALRAGLMAAEIGAVPAVLWGGVGTLLVVGVVGACVPALGRLPRLTTLKPDE